MEVAAVAGCPEENRPSKHSQTISTGRSSSRPYIFACKTAISGDKMSLLRHHLACQGETAEFGTLFDSPHIEPGVSSTEATAS